MNTDKRHILCIEDEAEMIDLIRIILVDDHAVVRAGLKAVLGRERDFDVVGEASNGAEGIALAERLVQDNTTRVEVGTMAPIDKDMPIQLARLRLA